jgi:hypothetical protein
MKITSIETCLLTVPTPRPMSTEFPHHKLVVADIETDEGVRGHGYSLVFGGGGAEAVLAYLDARLKGLLIGEDPLQVERLWEKMYRGDRGVRRGMLVGLCVDRTPELFVGLLGITKAGGAYVPLDPGYPLERLAYMAEDSGLSVLVSERRVVSELPLTPTGRVAKHRLARDRNDDEVDFA